MSNLPRKCIFCEGVPLTGEHMWADWLRAYIPRTMSEHLAGAKFDTPGKPPQIKIRRRTGDPHARKNKCVCGPCNSGWMNDLQKAARPFLVPLLMGQKVSLHRKAQTALATW